MNSREIQLWNYIDGTDSAEEHAQTAALLATDPPFYALYQEFLGLNSILERETELDEPSMAFTRNAMEAVIREPKPIPLKTKVSKAFIYSIAGVFIVALGVLMAYALGSVDYSNDVKINFDQFVKNLFSPTILYGFLLVDAILVLILLDWQLRKRLGAK